MLTNRLALLEYDVPGPVVIHERLVIEHVSENDYAIATPDGDVYVETLSVDNSDLRSFRLRPGPNQLPPNQLPPGVRANQVYGLPAWTPAELAGIRAEGQRVAAAERALRPAGQAGGAHPAPVQRSPNLINHLAVPLWAPSTRHFHNQL